MTQKEYKNPEETTLEGHDAEDITLELGLAEEFAEAVLENQVQDAVPQELAQEERQFHEDVLEEQIQEDAIHVEQVPEETVP